MNSLLYTTESAPDGVGFSLFSPVHLLILSICILLFFLLGRIYAGASDEKRRRMLVVISVLLLLDEVVKQVLLLSTGQWEWQYLPLHLCSVDIFITLIATIFPDNKYLKEYLFGISMPAAMMAELFPSWTALPPYSVMALHSFSVHFLLALYPILLLSAGFRPRGRNLLPSVVCVAVYMIPIYFFNKRFDTNFMFINGGGEGNPLSFVENIVGPLYLLFIPFMVALYLSIQYKITKVLQNRVFGVVESYS